MEALECAGDHDDALVVAAEALAIIERTGERWWAPEIHRLMAMALMAQQQAKRFAHRVGFMRFDAGPLIKLTNGVSPSRITHLEQG